MGVRAAPGCMLLVVGPSGAGKDSLLAAAQVAFRSRPEIVFVRRAITRPRDAHEDHDPISEQEFLDRESRGAFAISWHAHGLSYGVPRSIEAALRSGAVIVCNVSRTVVAEARRRFGTVMVVEVTAPSEVRAARLAARGRETAADRTGRLEREVDMGGAVDLVIANTGTIEDGAARLIAAIEAAALAPGRIEES